MRIVKGAEEARATILRRMPLETTLPKSVRDDIARIFGADLGAQEVVDRILDDVRANGDAAVLKYNHEIDRMPKGTALDVSSDEVKAAYDEVDDGLIDALKQSAKRVRAYHERQLPHSMRSFNEDGLGQIVRPLQRVGIYAPGTSAVYPSTVLMTAVPARTAGVSELVMATPVQPDGRVSPLKLVAAKLAGVDRVFKAGGVQGIGAMAYGTESVPRVDKVCGPGNVFVTLAKKRVYGEVGIDGVFGPSETLVIADGSAAPPLVVADMLAGAEHDELATVVLLTDSSRLADLVAQDLEDGLSHIDRRDVAAKSLEARGGVAVVSSIDEAVELASEYAPEHLCLHVADPETLLSNVRNAGCVFVGAMSVESIGDYTAGPSHVMPTGGSATFASPLGVHTFLKATSIVQMDDETAKAVGPAGATIARAEGFIGHARAIEARMSGRASENDR
jgi:histidinol dehydrogenase